MSGLPVILLITIGLFVLGLLVIGAIWKRRKGEEQKTSMYRNLFVLGIIFLPLGIIYEVVFFISDTKVFLVLGLAFTALGMSYLAIGLANRSKWKGNE